MFPRMLLVFSLMFTASCIHPYYLSSPVVVSPIEYIVRIESDGYWEGTVNSQIVSGTGTRGIRVGPHDRVCYSIFKPWMQSGMLRVFVTYSGYHVGGNYPRFADTITTHPLGHISKCVALP